MDKAIGLLSGGLDSTLATKLMLDQGIEVLALSFITPFCTCTRKGCKHEASRVAEKFGIKIKVIVLTDEYIKMVRNPAHGYGKHMNPCVDCRIFMFKRAKRYMEEIGVSFIFTGEVLGQRPMSQRKEAMGIIEKESHLEGLILRPLSARFLKPTIPEKEGLVDREKLLEIRGRWRKPQMELALILGIKDYPCPAGGCRLTDPHFARRVRESFDHDEDTTKDMYLLRYGRHFRLPGGNKFIVGRNEKENRTLSSFAEEKDLLMEVDDSKSPVALLIGENGRKDLKIAASICARYSDCDSRMAEVRIGYEGKWERNIFVKPINRKFVKEFRI